MGLTIGSICSGYGGLDMALEDFFGAETAWFAEFDPAPSKVLAHHWPTVPNLGDITAVDWASVPAVDIIAGGTPCQDLSAAGRRKGMTEGTRSNLWVQMREAIAVIRPSIVVWENVRGAFSAYATSEVESESGLLGVYGLDRPALRALGRVLGDLSDLGYDAEWVGVRASDAGAPHARFRVFVLAYAASESGRFGDGDDVRAGRGTVGREQATRGSDLPDAAQLGLERIGGTRGRWAGLEDSGHTTTDTDDPRRGEHWGAVAIQSEYATAQHDGALALADTERICGERWGGYSDLVSAPRTGEADGTKRERNGDAANNRGTTDWGTYGPAIERWERVLGRFAPAPTERSTKGSQRLSPRFVEWMMGLPDGWVTAPAIGLTRNQQLKALGNGVVPQQAELALSILWHRMSSAVAA